MAELLAEEEEEQQQRERSKSQKAAKKKVGPAAGRSNGHMCRKAGASPCAPALHGCVAPHSLQPTVTADLWGGEALQGLQPARGAVHARYRTSLVET